MWLYFYNIRELIKHTLQSYGSSLVTEHLILCKSKILDLKGFFET